MIMTVFRKPAQSRHKRFVVAGLEQFYARPVTNRCLFMPDPPTWRRLITPDAILGRECDVAVVLSTSHLNPARATRVMAGFEKEACHRLLRAAHGIIRVGADCLVRTRGLVLCIVFTATLLGAVGRTFAASEIEVFTREGCPLCRDARPFLKQLQREHPDLNIVYRDVEQDPAALSRLREIAGQKGEHALGVPAFFINDDELIIGFGSAETTGTRILEALDRGKENLTIRVPLMGRMGVSDLGLPAFTVTIGLLDGFNPCAMWVLRCWSTSAAASECC